MRMRYLYYQKANHPKELLSRPGINTPEEDKLVADGKAHPAKISHLAL